MELKMSITGSLIPLVHYQYSKYSDDTNIYGFNGAGVFSEDLDFPISNSHCEHSSVF